LNSGTHFRLAHGGLDAPLITRIGQMDADKIRKICDIRG